MLLGYLGPAGGRCATPASQLPLVAIRPQQHDGRMQRDERRACPAYPNCYFNRLACSDYYQSKLALEWRQWLTERLTAEYFYDRTFYQVQVT